MSKIKLIALFGESGSGKDYILNWIVNNNPEKFNKIISYTTRPPRKNEKDGIDYYFIDSGDFLINKMLKSDMLEYSCFNNWYYGTDKKDYSSDKINIGVFDPTRISSIFLNTKDIDILPIWIKSDDKIRLLNALNREKNPDCYEICRRFCADTRHFQKINFPYIIYLNEKDNCDNILNLPDLVKFFEDETN